MPTVSPGRAIKVFTSNRARIGNRAEGQIVDTDQQNKEEGDHGQEATTESQVSMNSCRNVTEGGN